MKKKKPLKITLKFNIDIFGEKENRIWNQFFDILFRKDDKLIKTKDENLLKNL